MAQGRGIPLDFDRLAGYLKGLVRRQRRLAFLESLLLLCSGACLVLLGTLFALQIQKSFPVLAFAYCLLALLCFVCLLALMIRRLFGRLSAETMARGMEARFPQLRDDVTNALLLFRETRDRGTAGGMSEVLIAAQIRKTTAAVCAIAPSEVVPRRGLLRTLRFFLPLLATCLAVLVIDPQLLGRSLALLTHPLSALPLRQTVLALEPLEPAVLRGASLVIRARAVGDLPEKVSLSLWPEGREAVQLPMTGEGEGRYAVRVASVQDSFRYQATDGRAGSPIRTLRVVDPPEIGKIRVTLTPPGYTRLPKEAREEGHIEALRGTVVELTARATRKVKEGRIVLNERDPFPLKADDFDLSGSLLVYDPGTYSIHVKDELGFENSRPVRYRIEVIPDKDPEAVLLSPSQDLEVQGNEVIPIVYSAGDDFGITAVKLGFRIGGIERSVTLKGNEAGRSVGPETYRWDLGTLPLAPGESLVARIGAWDNDTISGPKVSYSRTLTLTVRDDRARVAKEGEDAQRIAEALLGLLGDHLEGLRNRESLRGELEKVAKEVEKNLEKMGDRAERLDYDALKKNLASLLGRLPGAPEETVTQELERLALLAEEIARRARMMEVEALAREIRARQARLADLLKELKDLSSKEAMDAVMKELKRLGELLRAMMEAMSRLAQPLLPEEFANSPELEGLDLQDMFKDLEEVQKKLMAGDLQAALEMAQKLLQALQEMVGAMERAGSRAGSSNFGRLQNEMSQEAGELSRLMAEQRAILSETEKIAREAKRKRDEETEKRLRQSSPQLKELLETLRRLVPREQREAVNEMSRELERKNLDRFNRLAEGLERSLAESPEARAPASRLRELGGALLPRSRDVLPPETRKQFPGLSAREEALRQRAQSFREKVEMLSQLFPGLDTEVLQDLGAAADLMGEASSRLGGEDADGAVPPEQEVLRRLARSQQGMQQMAQQMAMRMQGMRWGYPQGYDPRAGWYYGPWAPMPTLPQPEVRRRGEKGFTGIDQEEFATPGKDAYKVPRLFREKIQESMKEEIPPQYKREVERYLRGLTE